MGKLYRRSKSPYWWARWQDAQGITRRESTRTADRRVATLWLNARQSEAIREEAGVPVARRIALADAAGQYLDAHAPPVWSERWHYTAKHWWRARIQPALGGPDMAVSAVTRAAAEAARAAWIKTVKPPTVNRLTAIASGFFRWASDPDRRYTLENPFARMKKHAEVYSTPPPLTETDLDRFLRALPSNLCRRAATVSLDTGMRLSEVRRVRAEDIHGDLLHVSSSYSRGLTKNRRERWLLLTPRAAKALQAVTVEPGAAIFADLPRDTRPAMKAALKAAKLARFTYRDLRHYALTRAARAGVRPHDLRGMAGWAGDQSARYVHPEAEGMRPFVECVASVPKVGARKRKAEQSRDNPPGKQGRKAAG